MRLSTGLPKGFHRPNLEKMDADQRTAEIDGINAIRESAGQAPFEDGMLEEYMSGGGLIVVRGKTSPRTIGDIAGYVVANPDRSSGTLAVEELFVKEQHRGKKVGGFLLGSLIKSVPYQEQPRFSIAHYGTELSMSDHSYALPGAHVETDYDRLGGDAGHRRFKAHIPEGWNAVRTIRYHDSTIHEIFRDGKKVVDAQSTAMRNQVRLGDHGPATHSNPIFAATVVLNQPRIQP